jgi:tetratricopeptide (TPR) repeat protein
VERAMQGLELTIFLSGTMEDLHEERTALREQGNLLPLYRVVAAEDWGARYRPPRELCVDAALESDVYLGLYGGRYGYIPRGEEISVTEWEFNTAREAGKPALIYIRRGRKGLKQKKFLKRVFDFEIGYNRRPEFENCDQLVAWVKEDLITLMEDLIEEPGGDVPATRDPLIYVKCRLNLALQAKEGGQWEHAVRHCQWVLNQGVWNLEAHELALRELQSLYLAEGQWEGAIEAVWDSIDLLPLTGLPVDELSGLENRSFQELARIYALRAKNCSDQGNQGEAVDSYREAEQIYRKIGNWQGVREIRSALAEAYEKWAEARAGVHRWADAVDHYRDALAVYEELENPAKMGLIWYRLGQMRKKQRKSREAVNCFERSLEYREDTDDGFLIPFDIVLSAHDEIINRRLARVGEFHYAALQLCERANDLFIAGQAQDAIASAQRALNLSKKRQDQKSILVSRLCLASLLVKTDQPEEAIEQYEMAVELAESLGGEKVRNELSDQLERAVQKYRGDLRIAEEQGNLKARNEIQGRIDRLEELLSRVYA